MSTKTYWQVSMICYNPALSSQNQSSLTFSQVLINMGYTTAKVCSLFLFLLLCGCGATLKRDATQQLLASDAVDQAVAEINFNDLAGEKVFFETRYIKHIKGQGFVNADYITSSLRQQMIAANLRLQENSKDADYIVEARVGALGTNSHEITYGIPQSTALNTAINTASSMAPAIPAIPSLPEISFAKKNDQMSAAKIGAFAYHRTTGKPVWQSGVETSRSTAKDTWIFGAGPFQHGTIYEGAEFAGTKLGLPLLGDDEEWKHRPQVEYKEEYHFKKEKPLKKPTVSSEKKAVPKPSKEVQQISASIQKVNSGSKISVKHRPLHIKWDDENFK